MENGRPAAYVTGIGVVSPIGIGRKKFWSSLLANESGAGPITLFDPEGFEVRIAAECTDFDPNDFMDRKVATRTDRFAQMGLASAKLALEDAGAWDALNNTPERVGLILGSGIGGVTSMETTQATIDSRGPARVRGRVYRDARYEPPQRRSRRGLPSLRRRPLRLPHRRGRGGRDPGERRVRRASRRRALRQDNRRGTHHRRLQPHRPRPQGPRRPAGHAARRKELRARRGADRLHKPPRD